MERDEETGGKPIKGRDGDGDTTSEKEAGAGMRNMGSGRSIRKKIAAWIRSKARGPGKH